MRSRPRLYTDWRRCSPERRRRAWLLLGALAAAAAAFALLERLGLFATRWWWASPWT